MQKLKTVLFSLLAVFLSNSISAQSTLQDNMYKYLINQNYKGLTSLLGTYAATSDLTKIEEAVNLQYLLVPHYLEKENNDKAKEEIAKAKSRLEKLMASKEFGTYYALYGAFISFEMQVSPQKFMSLGPKSVEYINKAMDLDAKNPKVCFEYANMKFYAPRIAGGNKTTALEYYKKTINKLESTKPQNDWYYIVVLRSYAEALKEKEEIEEYKSVVQKLLKIEPDYVWAQKELNKLK